MGRCCRECLPTLLPYLSLADLKLQDLSLADLKLQEAEVQMANDKGVPILRMDCSDTRQLVGSTNAGASARTAEAVIKEERPSTRRTHRRADRRAPRPHCDA